ncbi:MAG: hypothetical protein ABWZ25_11575 [Chitinophagaceae bacterium]
MKLYLVIISFKFFEMATNGKTGDGHRNGQVKERSQTFNPRTENWVKRDTQTGQFMDKKADNKPFKGVRKER